MEQVLLRPDEAAEMLGVSRATAYELMSSGELRSVKIGNLRRIPRRSLDEFVERKIAEQAAN